MRLFKKSVHPQIYDEVLYTQDTIRYNNMIYQVETNNLYNKFIQPLNNGDFKEEYISLVKGLDDESIELVNRILYMAQSYAKGRRAFSVSNKEKEKIISIESKNTFKCKFSVKFF